LEKRMILPMRSPLKGASRNRRTLPLAGSAVLLTGLLALAPFAWSDDKGKLDEQLTTAYPLTTPTADNTDIVTQGVALVLQKKGLVIGDATSNVPFQNFYKDGQIKAGAAATISKISRFGGLIPGVPAVPSNAVSNAANRTFVNGEKVYVTAIQVKGNNVTFSVISDAYNNVRYKGTLSMEIPKASMSDLAKVQKTIDEVFKIDTSAAKADANAAPADGQQAAAAEPAAPAAAAPAAPAEPAIAPIAPPPPPVDQPPATIEIGQTPDQVTAILGQPQKMAKLAGKEIYFYKNLKVTFKNGKVSDVE
jgi:hypothetical protein